MPKEVTIVTKMIDKVTGKTKIIEKSIKGMGTSLEKTTQKTYMMADGQKKLTQTMEQSTKGMMKFKMHMLGILFFGMMMQRTFDGLRRDTVAAFMKITEGATISGKAITGLSASWTYLQFSIGNAIATTLEPWLETIIDIVEKLVDWIDQNPQLTAGIIMVGLAIGTALMMVGQFVLGLTSISMWISGWGVAGSKGMIPSLGALAGSLAFIGAMFGFVIVMMAAWEVNWANIRNSVTAHNEAFVGALWNAWSALLNMLTGDWGRAGSFIVNTITWIGQSIMQTIIDLINNVIAFWNASIGAATGMKLGIIPTKWVRNLGAAARMEEQPEPLTAGTPYFPSQQNITTGEININVSGMPKVGMKEFIQQLFSEYPPEVLKYGNVTVYGR
jgi:hypothetical protein